MSDAPGPPRDWPPPYGPTAPPPPPPRRRHRARTIVLSVLGVVVALVVIGGVAAALGGGKHHDGQAATVSHHCPKGQAWMVGGGGPGCYASLSSSPPNTSAAPPPPAAHPAGNITGSCDINLSASLYGTNYLTAQINATNTGNVGTVVRVRVSWPLQGYPPIVKAKTIRTRPGQSRQVELRQAVSESQVNSFQDAQIAATGDPCHYHAVIMSTFGTPQG